MKHSAGPRLLWISFGCCLIFNKYEDVDWKNVAHLLTIRCSLSLDFFETWQTWMDALRCDNNYPGLIQELDEVQRRCFPTQNDRSMEGKVGVALWLRIHRKSIALAYHMYANKNGFILQQQRCPSTYTVHSIHNRNLLQSVGNRIIKYR